MLPSAVTWALPQLSSQVRHGLTWAQPLLVRSSLSAA